MTLIVLAATLAAFVVLAASALRFGGLRLGSEEGSMQFGGGRIGAPALVAGALVEAPFAALPVGPIASILMRVTFTGISAAGAFALNIDTAGGATAEGTDDADITLNALFTRIALHWSPSVMAGDLTPTQWRTILGFLNQRDFDGNFMVNGATVPAAGGAAQAFEIDLTFPLDLASYFKDGRIFTQGSERIRQGKFEITSGASLTPTVVLAAGSIVIGALTVQLEVQTGAGSAYDAGPLWRVRRVAGLPLIHDLPAATRLAFLDTDVTGANTVYTLADMLNVGRQALLVRYRRQRLAAGGYDVSTRAVPLIWQAPDKSFMDLANDVSRGLHYDVTSTLAALAFYEITALDRTPDDAMEMGQRVAAGGALAVVRPTPPSVPSGATVAAVLDGLLPMRIMPAAKATGPHARFANVQALAQRVARTPANVATATKGRNVLDKVGRR